MNQRILAIDAIRGICLINIFINLNALGSLKKLSFSRLAFCDSADIFVFLAGTMAYFAYVGGQSFRFERASGTFTRAVHLYAANMVVIVGSFLLILAGSMIVAPTDSYALPHVLLQREGLFPFLWQVITLQQSVGYSTVLRLYTFLLLIAPLWLWLASKRYWYPIIPAVLIWAIAGHFDLAERDSLTGVRLNLALLPWTLTFVLGMSLGAAIKQNVRIGRSRTLGALAIGYLLLVPLLTTVGMAISSDLNAWVATRNEHFWLGASKSLQSPMRILSLVSLTYLFVAYRDAPILRLFHNVSETNPLSRIGRRSLDVFVVGALLTIFNEWSLWVLLSIESPIPQMPARILWEMLCVTIGVWIMLYVADHRLGIPAPLKAKLTPLMLASRNRPCQGVANGNCISTGDRAGHEPDRSGVRAT